MNEAIKGVTVTVTTTTGRQIVVSERRTRRENFIHMDSEVEDVGGRLVRQVAKTLAQEAAHV